MKWMHEGRVGVGLLAMALVAIGCSDDPAPTPVGDRVLIYVVNTGEPTLTVIDHNRRAVVDTIQLGGIAHGQIPSHAGDRLYATTEDTQEVLAIDTRTQDILWRVPAASGEFDQLHQPSLTMDDRTLFAPDTFRSQMAVVDVSGGRMDGVIPIVDTTTEPGESLEVSALHNSYLSGDGRYFYIAGILSQRIAKVNVETREIERMYLLNGDPRPFALLSDQSRAYVQFTDLEGFVEVNLETGEEVNRIDFGNEPTQAWSDTNTILKPRSHGIGLTPDESQLWATSTMADEWRVYSVPDLELVATVAIPEGNAPNWIAFTPDGRFAYVSNTTFVPGDGGRPRDDVPGTVTLIDAQTYEVVRTFTVGTLPKRIHSVLVPAD